MLTDKQLKEQFRPKFWKSPEQYYPVSVLEGEGFERHVCSVCKKPFWSAGSREVCGDPSCAPAESFGFIHESPAKNSLNYASVWKNFARMFKRFGYTPIPRYPIVARWNPTMEFTNASIAAFQPYVISGEAEPPANPLVIPQFCFRTVDVDNVGITGSHMTVFNMIGQHMFVPKSKWDQNKVFSEIHAWLKKGLGVKNKDVTFIEDSWAGGGNVGACIEFFSRGCELGNQVYMLYEQTPSGVKELDMKVLDMGMGMERNAWFSQGASTIYDASFPKVIKKLKDRIGLKVEDSFLKQFVPYGGRLNIDEVKHVEKAWSSVARVLGMSVNELREKVMPLAGLYSVAEHARALLILLADGALPSNVGGGYNVRMMLRRAMGFIDQYQWNVNMSEVCAWHAEDLKVLFPEFKENLNNVERILSVEAEKYANMKEKSRKLVSNLVKRTIDEGSLLQMYDSHGVSPELIREEAEKQGRHVVIPDNFYARVSELHEKKEQKHATKQELGINLAGVPPTEALYFHDTKKLEFTARILKQEGRFVILDKTCFYPTSGGQMHDIGVMHGQEVVRVIKQGSVIVHELKGDHVFKTGEEVSCRVDGERRLQLSQNHTGAHILNYAARKVLGSHVNQAGAFKDVHKARLDITHYKALSDEEARRIEDEANKVIARKIPIKKSFVERGAAEKKYGVSIYQGGVAPGKMVRIVDIEGVDVEACGGTHLDNTSEVGLVKILKTSKISDALVRIEYVSGKAGSGEVSKDLRILEEVARVLGVEKNQVPGRARELFELWKDVKKKKKDRKIALSSREREMGSDQELLLRTAEVLKTQADHVQNTIQRFMKDLGL